MLSSHAAQTNVLLRFVDPRIGQAANFGGVILHGLCTYGFAARAVLSSVGGNDPNAMLFFGARFTSPVRPGDTLETSMWEVGAAPGKADAVAIAFVTRVVGSGKVVLGGGTAYVRKVKEKSKL